MKIRTLFAVSGAMMLAAAVVVPAAMVLAVENTTGAAPTTSAATNSETDMADTQARNKRAQERVTQLKTKLTAAETARIKQKCANSQGKLQSLDGRINGIQSSRSQVYDATIARLSLLAERLKQQGIDATQMQTHIDRLKALIATYKTDLDTYKTAVQDASAIGCVDDPAAFKAALEQARTAQASVYKDVGAIRTYVQNDVKTYVGGLRTQLKAKEGSN